MSSTLYRHLCLSAIERIRNVMTLQHLSTRAGPQHICQHTLRTAAGLANARGIPLTRPCLHFAPSAQLHSSRGLFSRSGLQSLSASQAQEPETAESEHRLAGSDLVDSSEVSTQETSAAAEPQQAFPGVQADSGIEVVSEAVPTEAVLSASVTESNTSPAVQPSTSAESSAAAIPGDWESLLQAFLDIVIEGNYFEGRPPKADAFSISILKRGILNFARARQDILFSLPEEKIRAVLAAGPPYQERKVLVVGANATLNLTVVSLHVARLFAVFLTCAMLLAFLSVQRQSFNTRQTCKPHACFDCNLLLHYCHPSSSLHAEHNVHCHVMVAGLSKPSTLADDYSKQEASHHFWGGERFPWPAGGLIPRLDTLYHCSCIQPLHAQRTCGQCEGH